MGDDVRLSVEERDDPLGDVDSSMASVLDDDDDVGAPTRDEE